MLEFYIQMIYPDSFENKIGFSSVRSGIKSFCVSHGGTSQVDEMRFLTDHHQIITLLRQTAEMVGILESGDDVPLHNVRDISSLLSAISVEGTFLSPEEMSTLRKSLESMNDISAFFSLSESSETQALTYPSLMEVAREMITFRQCLNEINRVIDPIGVVKDSASPELSAIRRQLSTMSGTINSVMRRVMSAAINAGYIEQDASPAMRDGRLVLPVHPMNKRKINGIVHDESASGKTVFIEPAEVVEVNNRLRELQMDEKREIKKILIELSAYIRPWVSEIRQSSEVVSKIDFIHAKAAYARSVGAHMINLSVDPEIELYHACHPGLQASLKRVGKEIVPINVTLSAENRILLISGPNAGGKSVCLKTVGIIQYMTQCGLLPTVYENSHIGVFESIFVDIGDDQSLEDDLSTYSSHLRNMNLLLRNGNERSLVLIDEFGGGTEPQIGGAIAQAILQEMNAKKMWGVITTHYQNLKQFADDTPGLINGSMLYDRQRMTPLFQLSIGHAGSSFAIEIARKTGLPRHILEEAEKIVGSDYINMDKYLLDIARDRRYWENKRQQIRQKEKKIEATLERYEAEADELHQKRKEIISDAKAEAKAILEGSNAVIERTIHSIRKSQAEKEQTLEARRRMKEEKDALLNEDRVEHKLLKKAPKRSRANASAAKAQKKEMPVSVGDVVKLDGEGVPGKVIEIRGDQATVVFGLLKTTVNTSRLRHTMSKIPSGVSKTASFVSAATEAQSRARQLEFSRQLDVRGMRADEALQAVTYYLDDAIQFNAGQVRILHGTGTGALRQAIRSMLDTVSGVKSYHDEHVQFGGAGITVVNLE